MTRRCVLCASADRVGVQLVEWVKPHEVSWTDDAGLFHTIVERWGYADRCRDRKACRRRVEAAGQRWPVRDGMEPHVQ